MVVTWYRDTNYELDNDSANMSAITNQPCDKTPCRSAYGTDSALALYCHIPSTN